MVCSPGVGSTEEGVETDNVHLDPRMSAVRNLHANWVIHVIEDLKNDIKSVTDGFSLSDITDVLSA